MATTNIQNATMEHDFDADAVNEIDQDGAVQSGPSFPLIQWNYGDPKMKRAGGMDYFGGFFIRNNPNLDGAALEAAGWEKVVWTRNASDEDEGYWKRQTRLAVLGYRHRWEVNVKDDPRKLFAWNQYKEAKATCEPKSPSSRLHALVIVEGLEMFGPFILTLKGSAALAFEGNRTTPGAIPRFIQTVITAANKKSKAATQAYNETGAAEAAAKKLPFTPRKEKVWALLAFWLPLGARQDEKGQPIFIEVGKDEKTYICTPEAYGLPDKPEGVNLNQYYVGKDMQNHLTQLQQDNADWLHAWDAIIAGSTENTATKAADEDKTAAPKAVDETVVEGYGL